MKLELVYFRIFSSDIGRKLPSAGIAAQKRGLYTSTRREPLGTSQISQKRNLHISESQSHQMLKEKGVTISEDEDSRSRDYFLEVTIDRDSCSPCIITSYSIGGESPSNHAKLHTFGIDKRIDASTFSSIATELNCAKDSFGSLTQILSTLIHIFFNKEAFSLTARISRTTDGQLAVARSDFVFDDAAIRSCKRQTDLVGMRDIESEVPEEVEAEKDGIVYIKSVIYSIFSELLANEQINRLKGQGDIGTLGTLG